MFIDKDSSKKLAVYIRQRKRLVYWEANNKVEEIEQISYADARYLVKISPVKQFFIVY